MKKDYIVGFPNRLKSYRESLDLNQQDFADSLNTTQAVISRYEQGTRSPTVDFLFKLLQVYQTDVNWLLTGRDDEFSKARIEKKKNEYEKLKTQMNELKERNSELENDIKANTLELKNEYKDFVERLNKFIELQTKLFEQNKE